LAGRAQVLVLFAGYVGARTASTVALIQDGDMRVIVDPGMVPSPTVILDPLGRLSISVDDVTDVILSHHHPDHTLNAALFPAARVHDHWAVYHHDLWTDRRAEGAQLSPAIRLIETPGHTPQDITTLVDTDQGLVALTHLWWSADGPPEDPFAQDPSALHAGRERVLEHADIIVPGHGAPFRPTSDTPR
jgi:glyoxylase-like metal-dependent hydrolase (beta-lactamase superfamily II)